jgi:hypothetical protein
LRTAALIPILMMVLDYLEDGLLLLLLTRFPEIVIGLASMASLATSLKLITVYLSLILMVGGFLLAILHRGYRQRANQR